MRKPPAYATGLLLRLGPQDESFVGDLLEAYGSERSRVWYWAQVLSAVFLASIRQVATHPSRALVAIATGWLTLLLVFFAFGDRTAYALAGWLWNWNRETAFAMQVWWPYQLSAVLVSYTGFALSALVVVRLSRRPFTPMLLPYVSSVILVLAASVALIEVLGERTGAVPVPHTLFYIVSVALPYQWRSGFLLAPLVILVVGLIACPPSLSRACLRPGT